MADIVNAFNDCIDRLQRGESLGDCLRRYPELANQLRPMLETAQLAGRVQVNPTEVALATDRIRNRVTTAVYATPIRQRRNPFSMVIVMAAMVAIAFFGGYLASQFLDDSSVSPGTAITSASGLREVRQLVDDGQLAEVEFDGTVTLIQGTLWQVEDILVTVPPDTVLVGGPISEGSLIRVEGYTTPRRELFAMSITLLDNEDLLTIPTATLESPAPSMTPETPLPTQTVELCSVSPSTGLDVAVRTGGGTGYGVTGQLSVEDSLPVIGVNEANNTWYAVQYDVTVTGWVSSTVTNLTGDCDDLPELTYPPLPQQDTPIPTIDDDDSNGRSGNSGPGGGDSDDDDEDDEDESEDEFDDDEPDDD